MQPNQPNQAQANISQRCQLQAATAPHPHTDRELLLIARAVITHVLRRPYPELACEHCYTASRVGACGSCVHRYASLPPSAQPATVKLGGMAELTIEVDAPFIQRLERAIAAIPAPHGLDLLGYWLGVKRVAPSPLGA